MVNFEAVDGLGATMSALADPARRKVLEALRSGPRRAGELADAAGLSRPAMSRHLKVLRTSGLIEVELSEDDARAHNYRLRPERLIAMQAWLDQMQAYWTEQLGAFAEYVEREDQS